MKRYIGERKPDGCEVYVEANGERRPLRHVVVHSPTGMEWGYAGSGPADLALSILADHLGDDEKALHIYQSFKWQVIVSLPHLGWMMTELEVQSVVQQITDALAGTTECFEGEVPA